MSADEKRISELAHQIWETEGKPHGQDARHWEMARKLAESEALAPKKPSKTNKPKELASVTSTAGKVGGGKTNSGKADAGKADGAGNAKPVASKAAVKPAPKSTAPSTKAPAKSSTTKAAAPTASSPAAAEKKPRAPRKPSAT